jgi:hypothetical protein
MSRFDKYTDFNNESVRDKMIGVNPTEVIDKMLAKNTDIEKVIHKLGELGMLDKLNTEDGKRLYDIVSQDRHLRSREEFGKFLSFMSYYGGGVVVVNKETYKFFTADNQSMNSGWTLIRALKILM